MEVNGLALPKQLIVLLTEEKWKHSQDSSVLLNMIGSSSTTEFNFLDLEGMQQESDLQHLVIDEQLAKIYGLASSKLLGNSIDTPTILDIDNMVTIIVNYDEEAICLDYRTSYDNPRVMACTWDNSKRMKWKIIAPDFNTFLELLNL